MNKRSMKIDAYFLALMLEISILFSLFIITKDNNILNFVMFNITFISIMLTYIGGIVIGLLTTSILIFAYSTYIFYRNIIGGVNIEVISYIWMIFIPIISLTVGQLSRNINLLQDQNSNLLQDYENLVTIDEETGLGNIKLFYKDLEREISMAMRHKTKCTLMLIKLPYYKEIKSIIGVEHTKIVKRNVSDVIIEATRNEDEIYTIENDTLAIIMANTDADGAKIVKNRIKEKIAYMNLKLKEEKDGVNIDTKISILEHNETIKSAIEFKMQAEEELQYDV